MRGWSSAVLTLAIVASIICGVSWTTPYVTGQASAIIIGTIVCGSSDGCGTVKYGNPIDVAGSVRAHRTDGSTPDVNASFTSADHGFFQLVVPAGTYELWAAALGYQTARLASVFFVTAGMTMNYRGFLSPCPSTGCVPVPEFATQTVSALIVGIVLAATFLMTRKKLR